LLLLKVYLNKYLFVWAFFLIHDHMFNAALASSGVYESWIKVLLMWAHVYTEVLKQINLNYEMYSLKYKQV